MSHPLPYMASYGIWQGATAARKFLQLGAAICHALPYMAAHGIWLAVDNCHICHTGLGTVWHMAATAGLSRKKLHERPGWRIPPQYARAREDRGCWELLGRVLRFVKPRRGP